MQLGWGAIAPQCCYLQVARELVDEYELVLHVPVKIYQITCNLHVASDCAVLFPYTK